MPAHLPAWQRLDVLGTGLGRIAPHGAGWTCHGAEVLVDAACWFRVDLDTAWRTTRAEVHALDAGGERLRRLERGEHGWTINGETAPQLHGCVDVDVAATPLTNTFPIRRLRDLPVGEQRTLPVAWIDVPSLAVTRVLQTYERAGALSWRYRDPTHGGFLLEVDEQGVVERYEGFAERV